MRKPVEEDYDSPQQCEVFTSAAQEPGRRETDYSPQPSRVFTGGVHQVQAKEDDNYSPWANKYQKWHPPQPAACTIAHDGENLPHLPSCLREYRARESDTDRQDD